MKKLIIGIVAKHYEIENRKPLIAFNELVKNAVLNSGAIPVGIFPPDRKITFIGNKKNDKIFKDFDFQGCLNTLEDDPIYSHKDYYDNILDICSGVIFQGGPNSDDYEPYLANYCYMNNIPIFGICTGMTNVIKGLGGHGKPCENYHFSAEKYAHPITIAPNSFSRNILKQEKIRVNSRHYGCVKQLPDSLVATAFAPDKTIEIVESKDMNKHFVLLVRFHPESLYKDDEFHKKFFDAFVKECEKRANI